MTNPETNNENNEIIQFLIRYFSFWPWYLVSVTLFLSVSFTYLRYADYLYNSSSTIEILDKSQESEMSLPTSMTVFNRKMVNLDNEIGVLKSYSLHEQAVLKTKLNIEYFKQGVIKESRIDFEELDAYLNNFKLHVKPEEITISSYYLIISDDGKIKISHHKPDNSLINEYDYNSLSSDQNNSVLPFHFDKSQKSDFSILIYFKNFSKTVNITRRKLVVEPASRNGDQLVLSITNTNPKIGSNYINTLVSEFDGDGISDRQFEYKRTIEFVDSRSIILSKELEKIENRKRDFKRDNKLTDINFDASSNTSQIIEYDSQLFSKSGQKDLSIMLKELLTEHNYKLLPINFGIEDLNINELINQYNILVSDMAKFKISAGDNNPYITNIQRQIDDLAISILDNLDNYIVSLEKTIENLKLKGEEFISFNNQIPEKEKILRAINRELEVKEALFLLLLQKREEASINFAVVKPSVKIIDVARPSYNAVSPNSLSIYLVFILLSILVPTFIISIIFALDNKVHTKQQLLELTDDKIQVWGEIPFIDDSEILNNLSNSTSRSSLAESLRMVLANMKYSFAKYIDKKSFVTLVTSSIKGEGKTLISSNLSALLASTNKKTILLGADLRNPQIHKVTNLDKNTKGLSDLLYKGNIEHYNKYLVSVENVDILLSGTIPPNPTELLTFDDRFSRLINILREEYEHIIIDSAPCLLVSDTFEISKNVDNTLYVLRANYTAKNLVSYINENISEGKLKDASILLNAVGSSSKYGYKYGYQYGYQYGYKYSYNYGYGYGYNHESSSDKK